MGHGVGVRDPVHLDRQDVWLIDGLTVISHRDAVGLDHPDVVGVRR